MDVEQKMKILAKELHKPVNKKFERRRVISNAVNEIWSADLVDLSEWAPKNNGYKYLLNVIDLFSRYVWSIPLKDKSGKTVLTAFKSIVEDAESSPQKLWVDQGTEFYNKDFLKYLKQINCSIYSTYSENKASVIERFNRTLKTMMWLMFSENNSRNWIDNLDDLIESYNMKIHSSIKTTPFHAYNGNRRQQKELWKQQILNPTRKTKRIKHRPKFKVGDWVRVSRVKGIFEKGYHDNWTRAIFQVKSVSENQPYLYQLNDYHQRKIQGRFYENEMQKIDSKLKDFFLIEKVIEVKKINGKKKALVKWLGYDDKENSWIDFDQTKLLQQ